MYDIVHGETETLALRSINNYVTMYVYRYFYEIYVYTVTCISCQWIILKEEGDAHIKSNSNLLVMLVLEPY